MQSGVRNGFRSGKLSFNSIQDWPEVQLSAVASDWQRTPIKPTWLFEGRLPSRAVGRVAGPPAGVANRTRRRFGHTYGHERVFGFGRDGADWTAHLDAPGATSMTHLAKLANPLKHGVLARLQPAPSLISGETGLIERLASTRVSAARSDSGLAVFYSANGRAIHVVLDCFPGGPLYGFWFNPRTGGWHVNGTESNRMQPFASDIAAGRGTPVRIFDPPGTEGPGQDWVLVLSRNPALY